METATSQLSESQKTLQAQLAKLQDGDVAFLDAAEKQHRQLFRSVLSDRFQISTVEASGRTSEGTVRIEDRVANLKAQLEEAELKLQYLWRDWETAQEAVAAAARDLLGKSTGNGDNGLDGAHRGRVEDSTNLFREKIHTDIEKLAKDTTEDMARSEKVCLALPPSHRELSY